MIEIYSLPKNMKVGKEGVRKTKWEGALPRKKNTELNWFSFNTAIENRSQPHLSNILSQLLSAKLYTNKVGIWSHTKP